MDNFLNILMDLSQGNPGALTVLMQVIENSDPFTAALVLGFLQEKGYRGSVIWVIYKDWLKQDVDLFIDKILNHTEEVNVFVATNTDAQYYMTH